MQITLTVIAGPHEGETFTFAEHDMFLVGRSKKAHFQLPRKDMFFSRVHFMVEVNPPRCRILDMGSRNGTHVNGQRVTSAELRDGDQIQAGHTVLRVSFVNQPAEAAEAPPTSTQRWSDLPPLTPPAAPPPPPAEREPTTCSLPPGPVTCPGCDAPLGAAEMVCAACQELAAAQEQRIPGYLLLRELGRGAMGVVSHAVRLTDGERVAIKSIIPAMAGNPNQVQRFLREASILRQLQHPHVVAFRDMGEANGQLFFVMEYVRGTDAKELLRQHGRLEVRTAVRILCQVLHALAHAHARGFVHRDIKPANILVAHEDGRRAVKLADFGLARVYHASQLSGLTLSSDVGGTLAYLAPEQITHYREVKPAADQYSSAATLYHLMTGKYIYDLPAQAHACFLKILEDAPVPIQERQPGIPDGLAAAVHRALARAPEERFPDAAAFRKALLPFGR